MKPDRSFFRLCSSVPIPNDGTGPPPHVESTTPLDKDRPQSSLTMVKFSDISPSIN